MKACALCGGQFEPSTSRHRLCRDCRHTRKLERSRNSPSHRSRIIERQCSRCGVSYRRRTDCRTCTDCDKRVAVERVREWKNAKRAELGLPPMSPRGAGVKRADRMPCVVCGSDAMRWRRKYCASCAADVRRARNRDWNQSRGYSRSYAKFNRSAVTERQWLNRVTQRFGGELPPASVLSMLRILRQVCASNPSFRPIASR